MTPLVPMALCLAAGAAAGALAVLASLRPKLAAAEADRAVLRQQVNAAAAAQAQLVEMRHQASTLRHDLRGILSPALLSADRLANSQDPAIRKVAEIVIRTVDRATARLADKPPVQESGKSDLA